MEALEEKLGYRFTNRAFLETPHPQLLRQREQGQGTAEHERLEFLGDSVLGMVVADYLFRTHPDLPEGDLTRTRAAWCVRTAWWRWRRRCIWASICTWARGRRPAAAGSGPPSLPTRWRRCWPPCTWTAASARPEAHPEVHPGPGGGEERQPRLQDRPPGAGAAGERPGAGLPAHRRRGPRSRQDLLGGGGSQRHPHRPGPRPQQKRGGAERGQGRDREAEGGGITGPRRPQGSPLRRDTLRRASP